MCKGTGLRIVIIQAGREIVAADQMKHESLGRCPGAFHPGRRASFGRVVCSSCGVRLHPLAGLRVPNHVAARPTREPSGPPAK